MSLLTDKSFLATSLAHFAVDLLNSTRPVILVFLSIPLGLTNTLIGLIGTIYTLANSISQPLFGYLADRYGIRPLIFLGVIWMSIMFGLAVVIEGQVALVFLILAALGSASFHPAGTMEATLRGRDQNSGRETTAASIFFLFGQGGLSMGPAIGGPILDKFGLEGLLLLLLFVVPVGLNTGIQIQKREFEKDAPAIKPQVVRIGRYLIVGFILLTAFRSWVQMNMITFLPKYFSDLGFTPSVYGPLTAIFMAGSAIGGLAGGWLGDRYSKRDVVVLSLVLSVIPLALFPTFGETDLAYILTLVAGILSGVPHSILVVTSQSMLPGRMGMASGLILGFTFASGALGTLLSGLQADISGFNAVFYTTAGIAIIAALLAIPLERLSGGVVQN
jgi:FSR family fosmidomycin resistance protein-like MFS transporter